MNFNPIAKEAYEVYGQYIAELLAQDIRQKINNFRINFTVCSAVRNCLNSPLTNAQ